MRPRPGFLARRRMRRAVRSEAHDVLFEVLFGVIQTLADAAFEEDLELRLERMESALGIAESALRMSRERIEAERAGVAP